MEFSPDQKSLAIENFVFVFQFVNVEHAMTCIGNFAKPRSQAKTFYDRTAAEFFNPMEFTSSRFYLAPEIVRKKPFGRASDLWSFGVTMFRLLCGKIPFRGSSKYALDYAIMNEQVVLPSDHDLCQSCYSMF